MTIGHEIIGEGPIRIVFLHGWFGDGSSFHRVVENLPADRTSCALVDYRGYGRSRDQAGDYTIDEIARDTLALADSLGWTSFFVVGHSMGGKAAQRVAALSRERVRGIVGVAPVPAAAVPFDPQGRQLFESAAESMESRAGIIGFTTGGKLTQTWVSRTAAYSAKTSRKEAFAAYFRAWADTDFAAQVPGIVVPVRVIIGRNDAAITRAVVEQTFAQWFLQCEIVELADCGHYPNDEAPPLLAALIESFVTADR